MNIEKQELVISVFNLGENKMISIYQLVIFVNQPTNPMT